MAKPDHPDVCIVGGGIVGLSCAYFLSQKGHGVTILERDSVGSHASGFAYGSLSPLGEAGLAQDILPELALARHAMDIHTEWAKSLPELTGVDTQHRFRPALDIAFSEEEVALGKSQVEWRSKEDGYISEWVDGNQAREIVPAISKEVIGAAYTEGVADLDPYRLSLALAQACESRGVSIRHGEVIGIDQHDERVVSIITANDKIQCQSLVLAMGPWSGIISEWINAKVPIRPLKGQILRLDAGDLEIHCSVGWRGSYACTKPDKLLWTGTTEEDVGFNDTPTPIGRDSVIASLTKMIPNLEEARIVEHTACLRPLPSDGKVIVGPVQNRNNVFIATGTGRKGILLGPALGQIICDLITTGQSHLDIEPFRLNRFQN